MRFALLAAATLLSASFCCSVIAEEEGYKALFDGKTLKGWDVRTCEVTVENGAILLKGGNGILQSKKQYADYIFEFDWKALQAEGWDSGVYFRYTEIPEGRPWPKIYQTNLLAGQEGNVNNLKGAQSTGLVKDRQWNHFKLTVNGTTVALEINGKPAWKADGLESPTGYIGLQAEIPKGGQFLFKNVRIKELGKK